LDGRLLELDGSMLDLSGMTRIMGILNVTPDSFSDGGVFVSSGRTDHSKAVEHALIMAEDGADIIDIGGESTRPGSARVTLAEELDRVLPVIEGIKRHSSVILSIDTSKAAVARAAAGAGASIINDISGGSFDPDMLDAVRQTGAAFIIMHMKGTPADMQVNPVYDNVVADVRGVLAERAMMAQGAGISPGKIMLDPGIGFGKALEHNLALINRLDSIAALGYPVVLGVSRKAFIGKLTGTENPCDRVEGTIASSVIGIVRGAAILRVHDVKAVKRACLVADAVLRAEGPSA
jgi:dihydropteroate synthase